MKECPSCAMETDNKDKICPFCGYEFAEKGNLGLQVVALILIILIILFFIF